MIEDTRVEIPPEQQTSGADARSKNVVISPARYRCLLYKVPEKISSIDPSQHKPSYVSIGPYHYRRRELESSRSERWKKSQMEKCKGWINTNDGVDSLSKAVNDIRKEVKKYYETSSFPFEDDNNDTTFCEMIKTDGCFLLSVLGKWPTSQVQQASEPILNQSDTSSQKKEKSDTTDNIITWDHNFLWHDISLYENQIPFDVLREICLCRTDFPVADALRNIEEGIGTNLKLYTRNKVTNPERADNVLHLCHELLKPQAARDNSINDGSTGTTIFENVKLFISQVGMIHGVKTPPTKMYTGDEVHRWRRATQYNALLVKFRKRNLGSEDGDTHSILDVRVVCGSVLEIPELQLNPTSWRLLRNLMLLEQTNKHLGNQVTAYCAFISQLASTGEDVSFLVDMGIIVHLEASDKMAANKLSKLCEQIFLDPKTANYLKAEWENLDSHCQSWWWRQLAKLRGYKDWNNLLVLLSAIAGIILLVCAVLQTVYTMLGYYK